MKKPFGRTDAPSGYYSVAHDWVPGTVSCDFCDLRGEHCAAPRCFRNDRKDKTSAVFKIITPDAELPGVKEPS